MLTLSDRNWKGKDMILFPNLMQISIQTKIVENNFNIKRDYHNFLRLAFFFCLFVLFSNLKYMHFPDLAIIKVSKTTYCRIKE